MSRTNEIVPEKYPTGPPRSTQTSPRCMDGCKVGQLASEIFDVILVDASGLPRRLFCEGMIVDPSSYLSFHLFDVIIWDVTPL